MTSALYVTLLELLIAAAIAWPLLRQVGSSAFRKRSACKALRRVAVVLAYWLALGFAAVFWPPLLHALAVLSLAVLLFERWRARPAFGQARGLPPGSLALAPPGPERDPRFFAGQVAEYGPVFKFSRGLRPGVFLYGHERAARFLRENDAALLGDTQAISKTVPNGFLRYMAPPAHNRYRRVIRAGMTDEAVDQAAPFIRARIDDCLTGLAETCENAADGKTHWDAELRDCAREILLFALFGVTREDPLFDELQALYRRIDAEKDDCGSTRRRHAAMQGAIDLLQARADDWRRDSARQEACVLATLAAVDPDACQDPTVVGNLATMAEFGSNDSFGLLQWLLKMLIDHPDALARLRSDNGGEDYADRFVKETLRLERSEFLIRVATADIDFEGFHIPKGWFIRVGIREGHRDPEIFANADVFDPDRFLVPDFPNESYAPFGLHRHHCLGAHLAHLMGRTFILILARGYELEADRPWPTDYVIPHWQPRPGHAIGLRRR